MNEVIPLSFLRVYVPANRPAFANAVEKMREVSRRNSHAVVHGDYQFQGRLQSSTISANTIIDTTNHAFYFCIGQPVLKNAAASEFFKPKERFAEFLRDEKYGPILALNCRHIPEPPEPFPIGLLVRHNNKFYCPEHLVPELTKFILGVRYYDYLTRD